MRRAERYLLKVSKEIGKIVSVGEFQLLILLAMFVFANFRDNFSKRVHFLRMFNAETMTSSSKSEFIHSKQIKMEKADSLQL